jgi:Uma2 family endonuclease
MTPTTQQKLTFEQFLEQCPEEGFYELVNGEIVEVRSTRNHDDVANFLLFSLNDEIRRLNLNYVVNNTAVIRTVSQDGTEQGRKPDVSVIDRAVWRSNRSDYNALEEPIQLAVEVTSTNWDDDYIDKLDEYQRLGIHEYWIVDYLAIASREYLGNPKIPTLFVFLLDAEGKYQRTQFRGDERIMSATFPELTLTATQVLNA